MAFCILFNVSPLPRANAISTGSGDFSLPDNATRSGQNTKPLFHNSPLNLSNFASIASRVISTSFRTPNEATSEALTCPKSLSFQSKSSLLYVGSIHRYVNAWVSVNFSKRSVMSATPTSDTSRPVNFLNSFGDNFLIYCALYQFRFLISKTAPALRSEE